MLGELQTVYAEFGTRAAAYAADYSNVHLCFAGCSHCCKRGAFFAVTLVEAVRLVRAIETMPPAQRAAAREGAQALLATQQREFAGDPLDIPGAREPATFDARVARVARTGVAFRCSRMTSARSTTDAHFCVVPTDFPPTRTRSKMQRR